jgi:hypothetical protein
MVDSILRFLTANGDAAVEPVILNLSLQTFALRFKHLQHYSVADFTAPVVFRFALFASTFKN